MNYFCVCYEFHFFFSLSLLHFPRFTAPTKKTYRNPRSTMSFSNSLNISTDSRPLDFGSMGNRTSLSGNTTSSPTTFYDGTLLSPANISIGGTTTPGTSLGSDGRETNAYIQLWCYCQQCKQELIKTKQELENLRYVRSSLAI